MICQIKGCNKKVRLSAPFKGKMKDFKCASCQIFYDVEGANFNLVEAGKQVPAGSYTTCTECDAQFKCYKDFKGKRPKCSFCRNPVAQHFPVRECKNFTYNGNCHGQVTFGPNPYDADIKNINTSHWICAHCRKQCTSDI